MIEHHVKGSPDEEFEISDDDKVNVQSQLAFWLTFLQRFNALEKSRISSISFTCCLSFLHGTRADVQNVERNENEEYKSTF